MCRLFKATFILVVLCDFYIVALTATFGTLANLITYWQDTLTGVIATWALYCCNCSLLTAVLLIESRGSKETKRTIKRDVMNQEQNAQELLLTIRRSASSMTEALGLPILNVLAIVLPRCRRDFGSRTSSCKELRVRCNNQMQAEYHVHLDAMAFDYLVDLLVSARFMLILSQKQNQNIGQFGSFCMCQAQVSFWLTFVMDNNQFGEATVLCLKPK